MAWMVPTASRGGKRLSADQRPVAGSPPPPGDEGGELATGDVRQLTGTSPMLVCCSRLPRESTALTRREMR